MNRYLTGNLIERLSRYLNGTRKTAAAEQLDKEEELAREIITFMDEMPGGFLIYRADEAEEVIYANKALLKIFRCSNLEEFRAHTGNSFKGVVHAEDLDRVEDSIARQIAEDVDQMDYVEYRIVRKDGEVRWVEDYGHYIRSDREGDIFYVFIGDITEEKQQRMEETDMLLRESDRKIQDIIENFDAERRVINQEHLRRLEIIEGLSVNYDTILYVDLDSDKMLPYRVSKRVDEGYSEKYKPYSYSKYIKKYVSEWVHPEDRRAFKNATDISSIRKLLSEAKTFFSNYRVVTVDGEVLHLQLRVVNVGSEKHISQVVIGTRNIDEEINKELERTRLLEEALVASHKANVAKDTFLSNMSHDMHTPLNAILGYTALASGAASDETKSHLERIDVFAKQLLKQIDQVLEASKLESTDCTVVERQANLTELVEEVCASYSEKAEEKNISFTADCGGIIHSDVLADSEKLKQVLSRIISNAIKYTQNGGKVTVTACETQEFRNGYAGYRFDVQDNGSGIEKDYLEHVFEPFFRVNSTTMSGVYGVGLGLTISKRLIDAMGGEIRVESKKGKGSKFSVILKLKTQNAADGITEQSLNIELEGKKILLVDDNEINLEMESELLREEGFVVETASDGSVALDMIKSSKAGEYGLILMDIQMPVMDGRKAAELIRQLPDEALATIPIIALSANAFESDVEQSMKSGMDAHLPKPLNLEHLTETIKEILRLRKEDK